MARASKTEQAQSNGMSWLALMPFPAFNPLNWPALALPQNAVLASLTTAKLTLDAWRAGSDSVRAMLRQQQDEMLKLLDANAESSPEPTPAEESSEAQEQDTKTAATIFVEPMVEATRAYGRVGKAFIVAQRDTLRALSPPPEKRRAESNARPS